MLMLLAVSLIGNHREKVPLQVGKTPASPIPKRKRTMIKEVNPVVKPVNTVNTDHHVTMRIKTARCPMRSLKIPDGISNKA